VIRSRPYWIFWKTSISSPAVKSSLGTNSRLEVRTISMSGCLATALRTSPSRMSSSRLCAPRSSRTRWKKSSASWMRQRTTALTQMNFLSEVGICVG
jgi:hypothetical protein